MMEQRMKMLKEIQQMKADKMAAVSGGCSVAGGCSVTGVTLWQGLLYGRGDTLLQGLLCGRGCSEA